jgi:hypothetical protein
MFAETFRKHGQERKAELYEYLGECSYEDICNLYNSTAFNEIAKGYMRLAVKELESEGVLDEEQARAVRNRFAFLHDEKQAQEVYREY